MYDLVSNCLSGLTDKFSLEGSGRFSTSLEVDVDGGYGKLTPPQSLAVYHLTPLSLVGKRANCVRKTPTPPTKPQFHQLD